MNRFSMNETTMPEAEKKRDAFLNAMNRRQPLRMRPCIVNGPNGGYIVVELGFAVNNDLAIVA